MTSWRDSRAIEPATREDAAWIKPIFQAERETFWDFGRIWWRYWEGSAPGEWWLVIRPDAFVHFRKRLDNTRVVEEIAVAAPARRKGLGRELLRAIGLPIVLRTDAANLNSNAFYQALGFRLDATVPAAHGYSGRLLNVYRLG